MCGVLDKMTCLAPFLIRLFSYSGGILMQSRSLTEGKIGPALLRFSLPFLLSSRLQALYGAVDLMITGQFAGTAAQAAVATGTQIMQIVTGITLGLATGVTVLIGHRVGARDNEGSASAVGSGAVTLVVLAAILTPVLLLCNHFLVSLMQVPEVAVLSARQYLFVCSCGIPFIMGYHVIGAIYRGLGDSKTPLVFIAIACGLNIIADLALVGGLKLGALGAALATVGAQGISFLLALLFIAKRGFPFSFQRRHFKPRRDAVSRIVKVGAPLALQEALVTLSFLIITAIVNSISVDASASVGIVEKIIYFTMLPPLSFGSAVAAMSAQNIGAGRPDRAFQTVQKGILYSLIFGVLVCVYCQFLPHTLTAIFSKDAPVIAMAATYLRSYSLDCVMVSFVFPLNSYFSGLGRSVIVMAHSLITTFLVRIPISYIASRTVTTSLTGMGFAPPAASLASVVILVVYFFILRKTAPELFCVGQSAAS